MASGEQVTLASENEYRRKLFGIEKSARRIKKRYIDLSEVVCRRMARREINEKRRNIGPGSRFDNMGELVHAFEIVQKS